ncbi:MAG: RNA pseudouridine synthase, partial [Elusimicrobia bacterium]
DEGKVSLRGVRAKASARLRTDDVVVLRYARREEPAPTHARLPILFEDDRILVVNKPPDLIVHPTDRVIRNTVLSILREQTGAGFLTLAHRLDRETSGVLVLAKDSAAAAALQGQFERREIRKEYLALVRGVPPQKRFAIDAPLGKAGGEILVQQAVLEDGAAAQTDFTVVAAGGEAALVQARPRTGRLHQIRVHLAHAGFPILGDKLYNGDGSAYLKAVAKTFDGSDAERLGASRQMLHARRLWLRHPETGPMIFKAPLPDDFKKILAYLLV